MKSKKPTQNKPQVSRLPGRNLRDFGLAGLAGLLAAMAFPNFNYFLFAFLFSVPLLLAIDQAKGRRAYFLGVTTGFFQIMLGFYWIGDWAHIALGWPEPLNQLSALGYALLMAQAFGLVTWLYCQSKPLTSWAGPFAFPLIWCTVFSVFPFLFPFHLGDSQTSNLVMLQPIEWTGVWGFDFLALLIGAAIASLITQGKKAIPQLVIVSGLTLIWIVVGSVQLSSWDQKIAGWQEKKIGLVQTNRPASIHKQLPEPGFSRTYPLEMKMTEQLARQGATIVFWPEGAFYGYAYWIDVKLSFQKHIKNLHLPLVFLDSGFENKPEGRAHYNTTYLLGEDGTEQGHYHKRHLVPFGEYTPFLSNYKWAKAVLGGFLATLQAGDQDKIFATAGLKVVPKICFEILFPDEVAESIGDQAAGKVLLVQSQDGWYGESSESEQHLASSLLRAIENRVPLIHVINNGPSAVISPNGRYAFKAPSFEPGAFIASFGYDGSSGGSFYSRHPGWTLWLIQTCTLVMLAIGWFFRKQKHV